MNSFPQRLGEFMAAYDIPTVAELARRLGYKRSERVRKVMSGEVLPSFAMMEDFARHFASVNLHWLLTGEGAIRTDGIPSGSSQQPVTPSVTPTTEKGSGVVRFVLRNEAAPVVVSNHGDESRIVMLDSRAAAGFPGHSGDVEFLREQPVMHLPGFRYKGDGLIAIQVTGDSMSPTIKHLDWLVARPLLEPSAEVVEGYVHVLVTRDGCVAKRLFRAPKGRHAFICKSDNIAYPQYEQPVDGDERIYMALAILSEDLSNRANDTDLRITRLERDFLAIQAGIKGR